MRRGAGAAAKRERWRRAGGGGCGGERGLERGWRGDGAGAGAGAGAAMELGMELGMERCGRAQPAARCRSVPILSRSRTIVFQVGHCLALPVLSAVLCCDCWLQRRVFSRAEWGVRSLAPAEPGLGLGEMASGVGSSAAEPGAAAKTLPGFIFTRGVSGARSMVHAHHCTHFFAERVFLETPLCAPLAVHGGVCAAACVKTSSPADTDVQDASLCTCNTRLVFAAIS